MTGWDAPVLTHLSLFLDGGDQNSFFADTDLNPFLDKFGPNLQFMSLRLQPDLEHLLLACPSLQHLVVSISELADIAIVPPPAAGAGHPFLGRVSLDLRWHEGLSDWMGLFEDHLQFFVEVIRPTSKIVCLLGSETTFTEWMSSSQENDLGVWRTVMDRYAANIEFEDDSGNHVETPYHFESKSDGDASTNEDEAGEGNNEEEGDGDEDGDD